MKVEYPQIGICGLTCTLCPNYHTDTESGKGCTAFLRKGWDFHGREGGIHELLGFLNRIGCPWGNSLVGD